MLVVLVFTQALIRHIVCGLVSWSKCVFQSRVPSEKEMLSLTCQKNNKSIDCYDYFVAAAVMT